MIRVVHSGSRILDPDADFLPSRIPDPGFMKAPDPGSRIRNTGILTLFLALLKHSSTVKKTVYDAGIGRDLALKLAACGGEVYGVSRTAEHLQSLKVDY
jgi:hypothetical protein